MIRCIDEISEQVPVVRAVLTTAQIESALRGSSGRWTSGSERSSTQAGKRPKPALGSHRGGLDIEPCPPFSGRRSGALKTPPFGHRRPVPPAYLDDVSLNAKGYERLVGQMSRGSAMADSGGSTFLFCRPSSGKLGAS